MKKIKLLITVLMVSAFTVSCDTDGGESELDLAVGAVPDFALNEEYPTILNLNQLSTGTVVDFGFTVDIAQGDVASADVVAFYQTAAGPLYGPVILESGVKDFPHDMVLSTNDIIAAFSELNSSDDFKLGDELLITTKLYLENGTELDMMDADGRLYGSDIHTSTVYDVIANYPVGCPLNGMWTGEYMMTVEGGALGNFTTDGVVTFNEDSQTLRSFDFNYLGSPSFGQTMVLQFVCETLLVPVVNSGLACPGGPAITYGSTDEGIEIDPQDDSGFTITITDNIPGACGAGSAPVTLTFVKQ
ncbi:MAG: hypothetical protein O2U61_02000 [Candidatus Bathyarchaeota archaeon]|nr:hypothetical protein [Candidatus Bathyarchaeota archaeon]